MKVICPNCKVLCHETTDAFNPDVRPDRSMVELLEPWRAWGHGDGWQDLECPACLSPLAPSGRLRVVSDDHGKSTAKKGTEQVVGMFKGTTIAKYHQPSQVKGQMVDIPSLTYKIPVEIIPDKSLSKAAQIKQILKEQTEGPVFTQPQIAQMVGTSPAYVSNVARKMREA